MVHLPERNEPFREPAPVNSSYVVFFHVSILLVATYITSIFPDELRNDALMVAIVIPVAVFWFSYLIRQFVSASLILNIVLGAVFVIAALSFLNALYGELSSDYIPVIYTQVPFFATLLAGLSGPVGLLYASTILTYGAYSYFFALAIASLFESIYESFGKHVIPKWLYRWLQKIDHSIDNTATRSSDKFFILNQSVGLLICVTLIALYTFLYVYLLIK